ncbi:CHST14 [Branchiostoma lanceolatum]|uniref:Carbohydrate sulfotransferase n=1 Tax=Branchiostoma lanceolatum TaxID=7740 RepID=A0A8K0A5E3_BRALA|nr:CHST14 [Branchiostoma lanceolatum]
MSGWGRSRRCLFVFLLLVVMATLFLATFVDRRVLVGQVRGLRDGTTGEAPGKRDALRFPAGTADSQSRQHADPGTREIRRERTGAAGRKVTSQPRTLKHGCRDGNAARDVSDLSSRQRWNALRHIIVNDEYRFLYCYVPKVTSQPRTLKHGCRDGNAARDVSDLSSRQRWNALRHIIVNDEYRFLYCYVPKVACTTWKRVISVLEGRFSDPEHIPMDMYKFHVQNWTYLSHYPAASVAYRLQHYYKFMFVRDPLARVVSAFRDKFERRMEAFSLKEAWTILETYRQGPLSLQNVSRPNITFQEFVQYVVDTPHSSMNQHWRSYLGLCQPCAIHYDFVGHLDTLEDDAKTVLSAIGADDKVAFPARSAFYSHASSEAAVNHYLSQLSPDLFQKLVSKYETDYSIFGYKLPER